MKKSVWIFLLAVFLPGAVLGWLALRGVEEQQIIFERRTAELYQKETEALAAAVRDTVEAERRSFGDAVHRLLARNDAHALAADFTNSLADVWPRKAVGFALSEDGNMLSPTTKAAADNAKMRDFIWNNGGWLVSAQPAVVYRVPIDNNRMVASLNKLGNAGAENRYAQSQAPMQAPAQAYAVQQTREPLRPKEQAQQASIPPPQSAAPIVQMAEPPMRGRAGGEGRSGAPGVAAAPATPGAPVDPSAPTAAKIADKNDVPPETADLAMAAPSDAKPGEGAKLIAGKAIDFRADSLDRAKMEGADRWDQSAGSRWLTRTPDSSAWWGWRESLNFGKSVGKGIEDDRVNWSGLGSPVIAGRVDEASEFFLAMNPAFGRVWNYYRFQEEPAAESVSGEPLGKSKKGAEMEGVAPPVVTAPKPLAPVASAAKIAAEARSRGETTPAADEPKPAAVSDSMGGTARTAAAQPPPAPAPMKPVARPSPGAGGGSPGAAPMVEAGRQKRMAVAPSKIEIQDAPIAQPSAEPNQPAPLAVATPSAEMDGGGGVQRRAAEEGKVLFKSMKERTNAPDPNGVPEPASADQKARFTGLKQALPDGGIMLEMERKHSTEKSTGGRGSEKGGARSVAPAMDAQSFGSTVSGGAGGNELGGALEEQLRQQKDAAPTAQESLQSQQSLSLSPQSPQVDNNAAYNTNMQRNVAPQQILRAPSQAVSSITPTTAEFQMLTALSYEGMVSRFVQDNLDLIFWMRPPEASEMVFGCLVEAGNLKELWPTVLSQLNTTSSGEAPPYVLALLDDKARPVAVYPPDAPARDWKRPFVASEIGEALPHWEAALYLATPGSIAEGARGVRRTLSFTVTAALALILIGAWLVVTDIRRQLALAQQKTDFVSNVSHELKTPLTSIRMFAELMHDRPPPAEKQGQYLRIITVEAERLTRLINNVLDFAKLERRQKRFDKRSLDMHAVIGRVWEGQEMHLRDAGFTTRWQSGEPPYPVMGDEDALSQVLVNLLSNAEKYSQERKEVELHTWCEAGWLNVSVLDRGMGVPEGEERKIFESFYRAHDSLSSGIQGSGLGLTLAQRLAGEHGGKIEFARREGGGSRFTLRIPLVPGEHGKDCGALSKQPSTFPSDSAEPPV